ncbi:hypothetical protein [Anaerovorax sp. IOR16]|nr:hypothetical protein [Anaerovorax sp. IOR16]
MFFLDIYPTLKKELDAEKDVGKEYNNADMELIPYLPSITKG